MLVWVLSAGAVSRYKAIKVIIRGLRFGINIFKSDKFRAKAPENQSGPLFSKTAPSNERGGSGPHPTEGGLSAGAGSRGFHGQRAHIMSEQVRALRALSEGFTQEVKS